MKFQILFLISLIFATHGSAIRDSNEDIALEVFQGFIEGLDAGIEVDIQEVKSCIQDIEGIFGIFDKAFQDIEKNTASSVLTALHELGTALNYLPPAIRDCAMAEQEAATIQKLITDFGSPVEFSFDVLGHIIVNHKEITSDIKSAYQAWQNQDYNTSGFYIGEAVIIVAIGVSDAPSLTAQDLPTIIDGMFKTGYPSLKIEDIQTCLDSQDAMVQKFIMGTNQIATKKKDEVLKGVKNIANALEMVSLAVQYCVKDFENVRLFSTAVDTLLRPRSFIYNSGKNLLINGIQLYPEFNNLLTNFNQRNWQEYGRSLGLVLNTAHQSNVLSLKASASNMEDFVFGVFIGIEEEAHWSSLSKCIKNSDDIINNLKKVVSLLSTEMPDDIINGLILLGQTLQIIPQAIQDCNGTVSDFEKLIAAIKEIQSPYSFVYHVGMSLIYNGREIYQDITGAIAAYRAQNWTGYGYYVGETLAVLILGDQATLKPSMATYLDQRVGWTAGTYDMFSGLTLDQISQYYAATDLDHSTFNFTVVDYRNTVTDIPTYFNATEKWPGCVHPILNQGHCGSCWAFGASETLSDRLCVASGGKKNVVLSPQYLVSCDHLMSFGCKGGNLYFSWVYMARFGISTDSCDPYVSAGGTSPKCDKNMQCADGEDFKKYFAAKQSIVLMQDPESIQINLMQYGPVETGMVVYQDFMYYKGGIYKHVSGPPLGGHAVKITGWGVEDGTNYWIVQNSWGADWGENGFFRIAFGDSGIDSGAISGQADLVRSENIFESIIS
jgi:cathepsin B